MDQGKVNLNKGEYVFCSIKDINNIDINNIIGFFKESEGYSIIISKEEALKNNLSFYFISAWITLDINSTLDSVGLTSSFSKELTKAGISCNVVAAYHHDHIFVPYREKDRALNILNDLFKS
mgnify:FL=1|tara:strand:- start:457 stop:822 length:366 start_codon:yes stop_codon:yes gene_type:complete